eukprot:m.1642732 g.1642732  ORF g.1642732 m.1642732 type:complete len:66 (+) comp54742_c0_seq1:331-528(+)
MWFVASASLMRTEYRKSMDYCDSHVILTVLDETTTFEHHNTGDVIAPSLVLIVAVVSMTTTDSVG